MSETVEVWAGGEVWESELHHGETVLELRVEVEPGEWKSYICEYIGVNNKDGRRIFEEQGAGTPRGGS